MGYNDKIKKTRFAVPSYQYVEPHTKAFWFIAWYLRYIPYTNRIFNNYLHLGEFEGVKN